MKSKKYVLVGGQHVDGNGKSYKKGDVIKSVVDLRKVFKGKFKLWEAPEEAPSKKSKKKKDKGKGKKEKPVDKVDARGQNVTAEHAEALSDSGLLVFTKGGGWLHVYEPEGTEPVNGTGLKADDVADFVEKFLEE